MNFSIRKRFGQHYLRDENIAARIVAQLSLTENKNVLEIGPGTGVLTRYLIQIPGIELKCIEIDEQNVFHLRKRYPKFTGKFITGDVLQFDLKKCFEGHFAVIGNFPYNISSQIFFKILESRDAVCEVVCMLQDEVARRLTASHGNKDYGILSVLLQAFYDAEYLFPVGREVFFPQPKVKSAVVRFIRNSTRQLQCDETMFFKIVKTAFNQRRKMLRNALQSIISGTGMIFPEQLANLHSKRAEQLTIDDFIHLTCFLATLQNNQKQ